MVAMDLSPGGVRAIAEAGYLFLFPLVANYAMMYSEAVDPSSPAFGGGFGHWVHRRQAISQETDDSSTHVTTLASSAWLDVRAEPWVLSIPSYGTGRTTVVTDLWGFVVDEAGGPGSDGPVVVASDAWVGAVPADAARVVRAESPFVRCETLVQLATPGDVESVREIWRAYRMEPLSTWSDGPPASPAAAIAWWPVDARTVTEMAFWPAATFALGLTTPNAQDRGILDRLTEIGVVAGRRWTTDTFDPAVLAAIEEGMDEALTELMRAAGGSRDATPPGSRTDADRDYFGRALASIRSNPLVGQSHRGGT